MFVFKGPSAGGWNFSPLGGIVSYDKKLSVFQISSEITSY